MLIAHRINFLDASSADIVFSHADGIEFDIRDSNGQLIVQHDPFKEGQLFSEFASFCSPDKLYIVNIKSEGIEYKAIELLERQGCKRFFLLDCSIPMIIKLGRAGETRIAARFSEFESIETIFKLRPYIQWVWVDVFTHIPLSNSNAVALQSNGLRLCFVSPELQGQPEKIQSYISELHAADITIDAVCTKLHNIPMWNPLF